MADDFNPFEPPSEPPMRRYLPSPDPSIQQEPHFLNEEFLPDPSEARPAVTPSAGDEEFDHSVWDEPGLLALSDDAAERTISYCNWLRSAVAATSLRRSRMFVLALSMASGICAFVGGYILGLHRTGPLVFMLFGGLAIELLKFVLPVWAVEQRPYLFKSQQQLFFSVVGGGLVVAVTEKIVYLNAPSPQLVGWGWCAYLGIHILCSSSSAIGLIHVWRACMTTWSKPQISLGVNYVGIAVAIHALYVLLR